MIAVDWSHTKDLTTFDGKKVRVETSKALLKRIGDSNGQVESKMILHSIVLEQGCPMNLIYNFIRHSIPVKLISNRATEDYRKLHNLEKSDEADVRIIYELANNGASLQSVTMNDTILRLHDLYHQYCRFQKARVAMTNMQKAHLRHYEVSESRKGIQSTRVLQLIPDDGEESRAQIESTFLFHSPEGAGESKPSVQSSQDFYPAPDLSPYTIAIDALKTREKSLLKELETVAKGVPLFDAGGESTFFLHSKKVIQPPAIKGLGKRLWLGILVTANPANFKCLSAYLRYCGLVNLESLNHKYNRHAKMLYHLLAEEIVKHRDLKFRPIYDKCKDDIRLKYPDYTKGHVNNAALNRTATFLAKEVWNNKGI